MSSPERLNVLLSRARDGLIMIGNVQTFTKARKGAEIWTKLVEHLNKHGNVYEGLPVICGQHPDRRSLLKTPADFSVECPDGGCNRPWYALPISQCSEYQLICGRSGTLLNCKIHYCPLKCHQIFDHSRVRCESLLSTRCTNGHSRKWKCQDGPPVTCQRCERERRAAEQAKAEQAKAERAKAEQTKAERAKVEQTRTQEQRETERSYLQRGMAQLNGQVTKLMWLLGV
jgi:hypothetical protein